MKNTIFTGSFDATFEKIKILTNIQTYLALSRALDLPVDTVLSKKNKNIFPTEWLYQLCASQSINMEFFIQSDIELRNIDPGAHLDSNLEGKEKVKSGFSRRLKKAREDRGYSFRKLSIKTGIAFQSLNALEKKPPYNPTAYVIDKLAVALGIPHIYLRTGKRFFYKNSDKVVPHLTVNLREQYGRAGVGSTMEEAIQSMEEDNSTPVEKLESLRSSAGFSISLIREESGAEKNTVRNNAMKANQRIERKARKRINDINYQLKEMEQTLIGVPGLPYQQPD